MTHNQRLIQLIFKIEALAKENKSTEILELINQYRLTRYEESL